MARTKKVTITLPSELLESMKTHTDNVSGYLTDLTSDVDDMVKLCGQRVRIIGL